MMPETCFYYSNKKCPYVGMTFCKSPCFDCGIGGEFKVVENNKGE